VRIRVLDREVGQRRHIPRHHRRSKRLVASSYVSIPNCLCRVRVVRGLHVLGSAMKSGHRTAGTAAGVLAMLAVLLILSTAACLFDEHGDHHAAPAHDLCAGLVAVAVVFALALMLETVGWAYTVSRWAMVTATGAILDPPPRAVLR
jgi:hypothetical protein